VTTWSEVHAAVAARCEEGGLDIVHPFSREGRLALLIGNTRRLWPIFLLGRDGRSANPLDDYVISVVTGALSPYPHQVRFAHVPPYVPIQRLAEEAGLALLSRTHLSIHPVYGPWLALRALAELDMDGPPPGPRPEPGCEGCEARCGAALEAAMGSGDWRMWLAMRDACNVGREWRYGEDQIAYHYTKVRRGW
jgi:methylmalonic aciduria homocystinuria type C protein